MTDFSEIYEQLSAPFPPEAIHWRIGSKSKDGTKARLLAYLNARDVMDRLDAVVGPDGWEDSYVETAKRLLCTLRIKVGASEEGFAAWVEKTDGAGDTNMEGEKGGISDAFKRAAVKWGIGRYLYGLDAPWVDLDERGNIPRDFNGAKHLPKYKHHWEFVKENWDAVDDVKGHLSNDEVDDARSILRALPIDVQHGLWLAPTKGSCWKPKEYTQLKGIR